MRDSASNVALLLALLLFARHVTSRRIDTSDLVFLVRLLEIALRTPPCC